MALPAPVMVFDDGAASLGALTDLRPVFAVRTGAMTLVERLEALHGADAIGAWWAPEGKRGLSAEMTRAAVNNGAAIPADVILVSGRCVLVPEGLERLNPGEAVIDAPTGHVVAARVSGDGARAYFETRVLPEGTRRVDHTGGPVRLLHEPWDVIRHRDAALAWDLQHMVERSGWSPPGGVLRAGSHAVAVSPSARTFPSVVLDSSAGPIVVDEEATLRPNAVICGPAYIGKGSTVLDGAVIRPNCAIGPVCKVNGEVSGTIFQSHANKAHDGFVGDSWIGQWANLGAGTITSNLLNTYSEIVSQSSPEAKRQKTGLTFFGAIVGDHVKTAIGTRLMTGSVIGTGAMIALSAHAPTSIGRFAWITDEGQRNYRTEKFLEVMGAVMARRGITPGPAYVAAVRALSHAGAS
jgi:UDP-N-acetylglucosamine diphosphorylase/glucosamine-1-phosphate N-acetyltransferase